MAANAQEVLAYIRTHGPAVPNEIRQAIGAQDNFVVGALLSELSSAGKLALTNLSYGTSRFYYEPDKPESIEPLGQHLNEKDQRAFTLLKTERVLRHSELSPLNRVAVASIKDFSRVLRVQTPAGEELFWRYYLVPEQDALAFAEQRWFPTPAVTSAPSAPVMVAPVQPAVAAVTTSTPAVAAAEAPSVVKAKRKTTSKPKRASALSASATNTVVETVTGKRVQAAAGASEFSQRIVGFFADRQITLDEDLGSTKNELTAIIRVPSAVGEMRYYCKAKLKRLSSDGDLAAAFLEAQQRGLPLLYLTAGSLSKKAQEQLPHLKGAIVVRPWAEED